MAFCDSVKFDPKLFVVALVCNMEDQNFELVLIPNKNRGFPGARLLQLVLSLNHVPFPLVIIFYHDKDGGGYNRFD